MTEKRRHQFLEEQPPGLFVRFILSLVEDQFFHLMAYFRSVSAFLESETTKFNEEFRASLSASYLLPEGLCCYDAYEDEIEMHYSSFPNIIRGTVLISACSLLETALTDLCHDLRQDDNKSEGTGGKGIRKAKEFLSKNIDMHIGEYAGWQRILDSCHIRDAIVHAGGQLSLLNKNKVEPVKQALKRMATAGIHGDDGRIQVSDPFIEVVLQDMIAFWKWLHSQFVQNAAISPIYPRHPADRSQQK